MLKYIANRLAYVIPVMFFMSLIVFSFIHLIPGDPVDYMLGLDSTPEAREALRTELGLDRNIAAQYFSWARRVLAGDFGRSVISKHRVLDTILEKFPATLLLAVSSTLFSVILSILTGTVAAANKGAWKDFGALLISLFGVSVPSFWLGLILILLFSLKFPIFPAMGYVGILQDFPKAMLHLVLPTITLSTAMIGAVTRMTRSEMIEQLSRDYINTAKAKGLSRGQVVFKHALRNSLITVVTFTGLQLGTFLGGTVIVEQIFAWPGLGRLIIQSIFARDYPMVQGVVVVMAFTFVVVNLLVDISYTFLDPRIRLGRRT